MKVGNVFLKVFLYRTRHKVDSLNMNIVIDSHLQSVGYKVILHSGVHLNNVTPFTPHVQVVDTHSFEFVRASTNGKCMGPIYIDKQTVQ